MKIWQSGNLNPRPPCDAKYPDSPARCSLPAQHDGMHCSTSGGVMWPNLATLALRRGIRVRHGKRAEGVIMSADRLGTPNRSAVLLLDSGKEKRVDLRTAPLRISSSGRGRAENAAQFRHCLGAASPSQWSTNDRTATPDPVNQYAEAFCLLPGRCFRLIQAEDGTGHAQHARI